MRAASGQHDELVIVGPIPPPLSGRSAVTAQLLKGIEQARVSCRLVDTAVPWVEWPPFRRVRRIGYLLRCAWRVFRQTRGATSTYVAVDASPGTIFTALYALIARLNGTCRIVLHHHSYAYVEQPFAALRWLCRAAGRDALHVTPCAAMSAELSARYHGAERTTILTNAFAIDHELTGIVRPPGRDRLALGHLSNLTVAKGTLTAIACFTELIGRGEPVELHLAGPIQDDASGRAIRQATARFGDAFRYHGPVVAAAKRAFFSAIDVFVFPTTFRNEVQPLVILESLAAGVPAIAYGRACIPPLLEGGPGVVVAPKDDFLAAAVRQIVAWRRDPDALQAASKAARLRFAQLQELSRAELMALVDILSSRPPESPVDSRPAAQPASRRDRGTGARGDRNETPLSEHQAMLFVGPVPPPVSGRTVITAEIARRLEQHSVPLKLLNTAPAPTAAPGMGRLSRAARTLKASSRTLAAPRGTRWAYVAVDADLGMYLTTLAALSARLRGLGLLLHHHNYSYLTRKVARMSLLRRCAGHGAFHINVCEAMAAEMRRTYPGVRNTLVLSNVISVAATKPVVKAPSGPLILGHLSNLTVEKGIGTAVNCLRILRRDGIDARLVVAGPPGQKGVAQLLQQARGEFDGAFEHLGPLYGDEKQAFYDRIDVFLFPSRYRNETQGIVNLEAMAAGVPVIAFGQCCIPSDLEDSGGFVVPCDAEFERVAVPQLARWAGDRGLLRRASLAARQRFEKLRARGEQELDILIDMIKYGDALGEHAVSASTHHPDQSDNKEPHLGPV